MQVSRWMIGMIWLLLFFVQTKSHGTPTDTTRLSIIYTGRSLGALGVQRSQEEHELITEQANQEKIAFKLVSHKCWRAPGLTIFLPSDEPKGDELSSILEALDSAEIYPQVPALRSQNVLLVQEPKRPNPDMLAMARRNPRQQRDFPELEEIKVTLYRLRGPEGERAYVVEEPDAHWPANADHWTIGEVNRVDIGEQGRLFELPYNQGEISVRSKLIQNLRAEMPLEPIIVDLGARDGYFGLSREERARLDFLALQHMDYQFIVPYSFELALGVQALQQLKTNFPALTLLAANLMCADTTLFTKTVIVERQKVKIGLIGIVEPSLKGDLAKSLKEFNILPPQNVLPELIHQLRQAGAQSIILLSNAQSLLNNQIAERTAGLDLILANASDRKYAYNSATVILPNNQPIKAPSLALYTGKIFAEGHGLSRLDLDFLVPADLPFLLSPPPVVLGSLRHEMLEVNDRLTGDYKLMDMLSSQSQLIKYPQGDLLFPAFIELTDRHPNLRQIDHTTRQGRVSQTLWEEAVARILRRSGPTEVAIIRRFPFFPPLIGKLHEEEVRSWLRVEDEIVMLDLKGQDLLKVIAQDKGDLVFSGIDKKNLRVQGRKIEPDTYYRIATTDVITEGNRSKEFEQARRIRHTFIRLPDGKLEPAIPGNAYRLQDYVVSELRRIRFQAKGMQYLEQIAALLEPESDYERLITLDFDRPTLWTSLNRKVNASGYGAVPESRIIANDAWVIGADARLIATYDTEKGGLDLGLVLAYAKQNATIAENITQITESADDIKLDLTYRRKSKGKLQPFLRSQFDTEFTPTINPQTQINNSTQQALRGVLGLTKAPTTHWRGMEASMLLEQDLGQGPLQFGFQLRGQGRWTFSQGKVAYALRNDATYFLHAEGDTERDLALRYNMVHEILVPVIDELALSFAADLFFFKGKVKTNLDPGMSMLFRIGLTYDRLWKPRYQPLF